MLNEVIGEVDAILPPVRDVNFATTQVCDRPAINMHVFTDANGPGEGDDE